MLKCSRCIARAEVANSCCMGCRDLFIYLFRAYLFIFCSIGRCLQRGREIKADEKQPAPSHAGSRSRRPVFTPIWGELRGCPGTSEPPAAVPQMTARALGRLGAGGTWLPGGSGHPGTAPRSRGEQRAQPRRRGGSGASAARSGSRAPASPAPPPEGGPRGARATACWQRDAALVGGVRRAIRGRGALRRSRGKRCVARIPKGNPKPPSCCF